MDNPPSPDPSTATSGTMVSAMRRCAPYIHAHRGRTFVLHIPGEAVGTDYFTSLVYDIALLASLGVRLAVVFGARPQIDQALAQAGHAPRFANDLRITDANTLDCIRREVGRLQTAWEAHLSTSMAGTPMGSARITTVSGNWITARPLGVVNGVNHGYTGAVRRIDVDSIHTQLGCGHIVLISCLGYSPSGEVFNLMTEDVASATATALVADKFVLMHAGEPMHARLSDSSPGLTVHEARQLLADHRGLSPVEAARLKAAIQACDHSVGRSHLVSFEVEGALLRELYTRDGLGTMVAADTYDEVRTATPEDVGGIVGLTEPLAEAGVLVPRSRESIELAIEHYIVMARDGLITACCALFPHADESMGELACVAVHADYRGGNRAATLLAEAERRARQYGLQQLFVLTTRTPHWFIEHGFAVSDISHLPAAKRAVYNHDRNSTILSKTLTQG